MKAGINIMMVKIYKVIKLETNGINCGFKKPTVLTGIYETREQAERVVALKNSTARQAKGNTVEAIFFAIGMKHTETDEGEQQHQILKNQKDII